MHLLPLSCDDLFATSVQIVGLYATTLVTRSSDPIRDRQLVRQPFRVHYTIEKFQTIIEIGGVWKERWLEFLVEVS